MVAKHKRGTATARPKLGRLLPPSKTEDKCHAKLFTCAYSETKIETQEPKLPNEMRPQTNRKAQNGDEKKMLERLVEHRNRA